MKYDPILITGAPRCGTSMLAGLLYYHGVWIGKAHATRYPNTNTNLATENIEIKNYLKDIFDRHNNRWNRLPLPTITYEKDSPVTIREFKEKILSIVDVSSPWLVKTSGILYNYELWINAFPKAKWLFPRRPFDDVMDSFNRHPKMKKRLHKKRYVLELWGRQDEFLDRPLPAKMWVWPDEFMKGSSVHAKEVVEFCGLEFDEEIFNNWIKPEMWHTRG